MYPKHHFQYLKYGLLEDMKHLLTLYQDPFILLWFCNCLLNQEEMSLNLPYNLFKLSEWHKDNDQATISQWFSTSWEVAKPQLRRVNCTTHLPRAAPMQSAVSWIKPPPQRVKNVCSALCSHWTRNNPQCLPLPGHSWRVLSFADVMRQLLAILCPHTFVQRFKGLGSPWL